MRKGAGWEDRVVDVRVDDHPRPVEELRRIVRVRVAWDLVEQGEALLATRAFDKALALIEQAAALAPQDTYFQVYRGAVTYLAGRRDDALNILVSARKRDSQFAGLWHSHEIVKAFRPVFEDRAFVEAIFAD
jgi:tetratricopeptide (TPR) repeat protein